MSNGIAPPPPPGEFEKIASAVGFNAQLFPIYYTMGPVAFTVDGAPSGAAGAVARLTADLSNFPHMLYAVRINNTYELGDDPSEADVQRYRACKEYLDQEQSVSINLAQQNITADRVHQAQLCGELAGLHWHPFPAPFPMAGGNNVVLDLTRLTSYPTLGEAPVTPQVRGVLLAGVLRADLATMATHRRLGP